MRYEAELTPMISSASICSVMRMVPISEAMLDPMLRWRIWRVQRDMEKQFGRGFRADGSAYAAGDPFARRQRRGREGDVQVRTTSGAPETARINATTVEENSRIMVSRVA